jgi:hypothetical protein
MRFVFQGSHISRNAPAPHWAAIMKTGLSLIGPDVGQPLSPSSPLDPQNTAILADLLKSLGYKVRQPKAAKAKAA